MNDGVEVLLKVDPFRQAVGGDQDRGAFGCADLRHPFLALLGGHLAGHGVDGGAPQFLAEAAGHVVGGRDEATEHHHVEPVRDQLRDVLRCGPELRIAALTGKSFCLTDQPCQNRVVAAGRGLDVVRDQCIGVAVEYSVENIFTRLVAQVFTGTGAKRQHRRDGARPGAA